MLQPGQVAQNFLQQSRQQKTGSPMSGGQMTAGPMVSGANVHRQQTPTPTQMGAGGVVGGVSLQQQQQTVAVGNIRPLTAATMGVGVRQAQSAPTQVLTQQQLQQRHMVHFLYTFSKYPFCYIPIFYN